MPEDRDDPVARNRSTPRRRTPAGREQTGWPVTRRLFAATALTVLGATLVLLAVLTAG